MPINPYKHLLRKLRQIEEHAQFALLDAPPGLGREHLRLIIGLAKYLSTEIRLSSNRAEG